MGIWKKSTSIYDDLAEVEDHIRSGLKTNQSTLKKAIGELLDAGGKRLRPALVLLSGRFGKYDKDKLIPLAAAIEILHMATLVHDDIIDDAVLRRGVQTVQSKWGKDIAVFTGDFLFTRAFAIITRETSFENMHYLAKVIKAICEGEIEQYKSRYDINATKGRYLKRIGRKTALLFGLSCRVGARESRCHSKVEWNLWHYGYSLGMAFQITDDLLDFYGDPKKVGKPLLSDFVSGVFTMPVIYALNISKYRDKIKEVVQKGTFTNDEVIKIKDWVEESGGIEYTRDLAGKYLDRARGHLMSLPNIEARNILQELIDEIYAREY